MKFPLDTTTMWTCNKGDCGFSSSNAEDKLRVRCVNNVCVMFAAAASKSKKRSATYAIRVVIISAADRALRGRDDDTDKGAITSSTNQSSKCDR